MYPNLKDKILSKNPESIAIPSITKAELLYGGEKSRQREKNLAQINEFLLPFQVEPFSNCQAPVYASVRSRLEKAGNPIGPNDVIIASIVLSNDGVLVTHNTREFSRVDGLKIEDWTH
ncbi:MAG: PIN domain-containing protein [Spirochaetales bacterium]|nr:PIN domain-containing protein [Spirochaetales bacterium]